MTEHRLFLTEEELAQLTGFKRHQKQAAWLRQNGIAFTLNGRNRPVVTVAALGGGSKPAKTSTGWEPASDGQKTLQKRQPSRPHEGTAAR